MKMKHILIVDDDIHINKMLDEVLVHERYMCHLANEINIQLRKLRAERRKFQKGDIELKNVLIRWFQFLNDTQNCKEKGIK